MCSDSNACTLNCLGEIERPDGTVPCILRLSKPHFVKENVAELVTSQIGRSKVELSNDVYTTSYQWLADIHSRAPDLRIDMICPCTDVHIIKYSDQKRYMVTEDIATYQSTTLPFIKSIPAAATKWFVFFSTSLDFMPKLTHLRVLNILDGSSEAESVLLDVSEPNQGFVILPDLKWDTSVLTSLYCQVIVRDASIRCLRDLRTEHIPLLRAIERESTRVIREKYNVEASQLRFLVHYHPSYYHFHVHVLHSQHKAPLTTDASRAHQLHDIISLVR